MDRKRQKDDVIRRSRAGQSGWRIARETGVPLTTVYNWLENPDGAVRRARKEPYRQARLQPEKARAEVLRLIDQGFTGYRISKLTGVPKSTVYHWRDNRERRPARANARCFRCDTGALPDEPAYAYLLGQYLGDGHIVHTGKVLTLSISCCDGWPGIMDEVAAAIRAALPGISVWRARKVGCTSVSSASRHWLCLFPQHGPGLKWQRHIALQPWQWRIVHANPEPFIRGLIHSDGCRATNRVRRPLPGGDRWYEYPRYFFANESADILAICGRVLDHLGIAWRYSRRNCISVAKRDSVALLDEFVGPKY